MINRRDFNMTALGAFGAALTPLSVSLSAPAPSGKPTDIRVVEADCRTENYRYRSPMKFGGRVMTDITLLDVRVKVESRDGKTASGSGSMTMGNIWAWPGGKTDPETTLRAMIDFGKRTVAEAPAFKQYGHPLEWTDDYSKEYDRFAGEIRDRFRLEEPMPLLACQVAASALEAAVFDAYGNMLDKNVHNLLSADYCNRDLSFYLGPEFKGEYLDRYTLREPKKRMPLYHLVGALDPLTPAEVTDPVGDGLPEDLGRWIRFDGLTHIKIKLNGDDLPWDVDRVVRIDRVAVAEQEKRGCTKWVYSVDFNERCRDVAYVLDFFKQLRERSPGAFERLQYIEQPTHRDLEKYPDNKMHEAAAIRPVVIDESLVDLRSLHRSREAGYSGIALKACKGHGRALLMGAAAQKYGLFLCVQDLTCPGASFLQSATLSARIPTVAAVEGNARQYCPAANAAWLRTYPSLFEIKDGTVGTGVLDGPGLY